MKPPKVSSLFREVELSFARHTSPRMRSQKLAAYALEKITEAKIANGGGSGRLAPHRQIVDGREGAALASVKPDGVIVAKFNLVGEVLDFIGGELRRLSPVLTGVFRDSHVLYVDDVPHDPGTPYPEGKEFLFISIQPYARKIEGGSSKKVPAGLYEGLAAVAGKRFGNLARIGFAWRPVQGAAPLEAWAGKTGLMMKDHRGKPRRNQNGRDEWLRRQPAIRVRPF